jgi:gas vesicle protein
VTPEETMAKSAELDRFLVKARNELMPITTGTRSKMLSIKDLMKPVEEAMGGFQDKMRAKAAEMARDISLKGEMVVKKIDDEHQENLKDFADMLGNEHEMMMDDVEGKPQAGEGDPATIPPKVDL